MTWSFTLNSNKSFKAVQKYFDLIPKTIMVTKHFLCIPKFLTIFKIGVFNDSSDQSHFIFGINVWKSRIRHGTTLDWNLKSTLSRSRNSLFCFRVVLCHIRLFPTLLSKIKCLRSGLPLNF